ncbi:hypothetical protein ABW19_dt0210621 [Dactylella cylindrospora]|nr:hypothetical protein ABW19_dt0210621 [Dactylella cylindrospora]
MPTGAPPLKVKLLVVETSETSHDEFRTIQGYLERTFTEESGWRSSVETSTTSEHQFIFTHRKLTEPTGHEEALACHVEVGKLADNLCDPSPSNNLSLDNISKGVNSIRYMPYTLGQLSLQKHFNRQFFIAWQRAATKEGIFEDMDLIVQNYTHRSPPKWLLGP